ncbi:DUF58 domain-containing protein [Zafaria sp. Z1313]|uniref:DUF58 domain-containing protein n=1 Tax=Zafaria sp. Z1313 TaxID=3423202 RepID=UPI003D3033E0
MGLRRVLRQADLPAERGHAPARPVAATLLSAERSPAWGVGVVAAIALAVGGVLAGRPDVAALGGLLALMSTGPLAARPPGRPELGFGSDAVDDAGRRTAVLRDAGDGSGRLMVLRGRGPGARQSCLVAASTERLELRVPLPLSGRREVLRYAVSTASADLVALQDEGAAGSLVAGLRPLPARARRLALPHRLRSHAGDHRGPLAGGGTDTLGTGTWQAGDGLRSIDWRATARSTAADGMPVVRRFAAPADAAVVLAVDARADVPADAAAWSRPLAGRLRMDSSLHRARSAAATIAHSYLAAGDRVGMMDAFGFAAPLPPAAGHRQFELLRRRLTTLAVPPTSLGPERPPQPPPGALVFLLSPFLEPDACERAAEWVRTGHVVAAVDTLPELDLGGTAGMERAAWELLLASRAASHARLAERGIALLPAEGVEAALDAWAVRRMRAPGGPR